MSHFFNVYGSKINDSFIESLMLLAMGRANHFPLFPVLMLSEQRFSHLTLGKKENISHNVEPQGKTLQREILFFISTSL